MKKCSQCKDSLKYQCEECRKKEKTQYKHDWYKKNYVPKKKNINVIKKHSSSYKSIRNCLRSVLRSKSNKLNKNLGYSSQQLIIHIENLWSEGMNWDNYGEWHIDHIVPICNFPESTPISLINSLVNLRPLWKTRREVNGQALEVNLNRKRDKINYGTLENCSIITDIDGTLVHHYIDENGKGLELNIELRPTKILPGVIEKFKEWNELNYHIILTTARKEELRKITIKELSQLNIKYNHLLMDISGPRILINDRKTNSHLPTAIAINLCRNEGLADLDLNQASQLQTLADFYKVKLKI